MPEEDRDLLWGVLDETASILGEVVAEPEGLVPSELVPSLSRAWEEALASLRVLQNALSTPEFDSQLEEYGLTGASLRFKLTGFNLALSRWRGRPGRRWGRWILKSMFRGRGRPGGRWGRGILKSIFRWLNVILGSLVSAIPGVGDALKEFKEAIESGVEDLEAEERGELA
jgi:hypothetical protein